MQWYWDLVFWLEQNQAVCLYKNNFGVECPGCGMQRAFIALLKGNLLESLQIFPALIPLIVMFIFLILHLIFKFKNGAKVLIYMFFINSLIIVLNYVYKMFLL